MTRVSVADAKAHLSELVERAASGDAVCITRRGKPIAQLIAVSGARKRLDIDAIRALAASMPTPVGAGSTVRDMRDEDRY